MSKMNPVVHFEMPYDDRERMAKFYQGAFGWRTQTLGEEMGNYVLVTTTETDGSRPKEQARSMVASSRKGPTGRRNIRPSSSRSMTSRPR
jgi:predicted enzyme related to lactoylglutathione lyase